MENKAIIWKWAVGLLVLCNVALIATIWLRTEQNTAGRPETPRDFVIRNLKFSQDQVSRYDVMISAHRKAMDSLHREAMNCRQQLFSNLRNGGTGANPDSLSLIIAHTQQAIELITYRHFEQVRTICAGNQVPEFDRIIGDVIRKMNGHHGPPGDRDGRGPGGDRREGPPHDDRQGPPPGPPPGEN